MRKQKTYKQIEASRNTRLWITSVILPVATMGTTIFATLYNNNLEFRYGVNSAANKVKNVFRRKKNEGAVVVDFKK